MKKIWITWEKQTRNKSMSQMVGADLYEIIYTTNPTLRYLFCILKTAQILFRTRPTVTFVQSPSVLLAWLVSTIFRPLCRKVIIDAHNCAVDFSEQPNRIARAIGRQALLSATLVIVHNSAIRQALPSGVRSIVVHDPLPKFFLPSHSKSNQSVNSQPVFFVISSWAEDEPIEELIEAARKLEGEVAFEFSGKVRTKRIEDIPVPSNIQFLGFIPEDEYVYRLAAATASIVLTRRPNCVNCGAYESATLGVPMILANWPILHDTFPYGAIFTSLNADSIVEAVRKVLVDNTRLLDDLTKLKNLIRLREWEENESLTNLIGRP